MQAKARPEGSALVVKFDDYLDAARTAPASGVANCLPAGFGLWAGEDKAAEVITNAIGPGSSGSCGI